MPTTERGTQQCPHPQAFAKPTNPHTHTPKEVLEAEEGGGSGIQKVVYQKWPNHILPVVNFVFSHNGHFGWGGGRVQGAVTLSGHRFPHCGDPVTAGVMQPL